jgi:spermidine synthase
VAFTLGLVVMLAGLIGWKDDPRHGLKVAVAGLGLFILAVNSPALMRSYGIVSDNLYSQVRIHTNPAEGSRMLIVNNSPSSKVAARPENRFAYIKYIDQEVLKRLDPAQPHRILVIGAGGFTLGLEDRINAYTYVDIDPALKDVSEEHFLRQPLTPNKTFVPESARAFLRRNTQTFDIVVLDAFTNRINLPPDLITREAFAAARQAVAPGGQVIMNIITSPTFSDRFSRSIDATIRSVFPFVSRQILPGTQVGSVASVLYLALRLGDEPHDIYTDNQNRSFLDQ